MERRFKESRSGQKWISLFPTVSNYVNKVEFDMLTSLSSENVMIAFQQNGVLVLSQGIAVKIQRDEQKLRSTC
jgi:type VI protein secretion system component VasA